MLLFRHKLALTGFAATFIVAVVLWNSSPNEYDYRLKFGGLGGPGWPLWVERFSFDDLYSTSVGNLSGGRSTAPDYIPGGAGHSIGRKMPVPQELSARWFSFRNQTFYEVRTEIDRDTRKALARWHRQYDKDYYNHYLTIGYAGQGYWSAWWVVYCNTGAPCQDDFPQLKKTFPLFNKVPAQEAPGDPRRYVVRSEAMIRDGRMPPVALPVRPEPGTGSEVLDDYRTITLDPLMSTSHFLYRFVFSDGTTLDGQTQRSTGYLRSIQWPDVNNPPVLLEVWLPDGTRFISRNLRVRYHGYGLTERHYTDENGVLVLDRRFLGLPPHIDFEK